MLVQESDRYRITFTTKWGTYAYCKMPFGLTNVGAKFHKAIEIAFKGVLDNFMLIYLDDITAFSSKHATYHFDHLR